MFVLNEMPPQIEAGLIERLRLVETATVGHFRIAGFMDTRIAPVIPAVRAAGTAVTVQLHGIDTAVLTYALGLVRPGDVLVVDRCGESRHASWGAMTSAAARHAGLAAAILDGRVCDLPDIRDIGMPVWSIGASPILGRSLAQSGAMNVPVSCGNVTVNPGDAILADESGVLVLRPDEIAAVCDTALARQEKEKTTLARLAAGEKLPDISGTGARVAKAAGIV